MSTTALFVELIVIGVGAAIWITLAIVAIFGYEWVPIDKLGSTPALITALSIVYVLGILIDRIADQAFSHWDNSIWVKACAKECKKQYEKDFNKKCEKEYKKECKDKYEDNVDYSTAKTELFHSDETKRSRYLYARTRLRICRGWVLNSCFIFICLSLFLWSRVHRASPNLADHIFIGSLILFLSLAGIAGWAWRKLTKKLREELARFCAKRVFASKTFSGTVCRQQSAPPIA